MRSDREIKSRRSVEGTRSPGELTRKLAAALENISRNSEIPREWFEGSVENYLTSNYRHIAAEEQTFFPQAVLTLHQEDWDEIDASVTAKEIPLFGSKIAKDYRALYVRIIRSIVWCRAGNHASLPASEGG